MMLLTYGTAVAEGVAQEKGTRVMELVVCRVRARDLLAGKGLGIGLVGLGQMLLALAAGGAAIVALVSRVEDLQAAVAPLTWTMTLCSLTALVAAESPDAMLQVQRGGCASACDEAAAVVLDHPARAFARRPAGFHGP